MITRLMRKSGAMALPGHCAGACAEALMDFPGLCTSPMRLYSPLVHTAISLVVL